VSVGHPLLASWFPNNPATNEYVAGLDNIKKINVPYNECFNLMPFLTLAFPIVKNVIIKNTSVCVRSPKCVGHPFCVVLQGNNLFVKLYVCCKLIIKNKKEDPALICNFF
jgi:hypothetical protein